MRALWIIRLAAIRRGARNPACCFRRGHKRHLEPHSRICRRLRGRRGRYSFYGSLSSFCIFSGSSSGLFERIHRRNPRGILHPFHSSIRGSNRLGNRGRTSFLWGSRLRSRICRRRRLRIRLKAVKWQAISIIVVSCRWYTLVKQTQICQPL